MSYNSAALPQWATSQISRTGRKHTKHGIAVIYW